MSLRRLKKQVEQLFLTRTFESALSAVVEMPARKVVNPLFGLLYHGDLRVRWHAVAAMGDVVSRLADADMESARVIMRRLMWNLNDESGGIGWGSPEAMGEIMARHSVLAQEYASILISYLNPDGNYLEHEGLQEGVLWAVGRLARVRPHPAGDALGFISPHFASVNPILRGMALWAAIPLAGGAKTFSIDGLSSDRAEVSVFEEGVFVRYTISHLASLLKAAGRTMARPADRRFIKDGGR